MMIKTRLLLAGVLIAVLVVAACPAPAPTPTPTATAKPAPAVDTYTDERTPITVNIGQQFAIALTSNPSTGFGWTAQFDAKVLSQVSKDFSSTAATPMPGSGGTDRFVFQGLSAGTVDLKFSYARSFDPPTTVPASTKVFKVTVK